jgi:WD40 repeat protein
MERNYQRKQLEFLSRILGRELYFLEYWPNMLTSHFYNTIFLDEGKSSQTGYLLEKACKVLAGRLWLKICNRPLVSRSMLIRIFEHGDTVWAVVWSPDGSLIASAGADGRIRVWGKHSKRLFYVLRSEGGGINALAWSPDGRLLASGHDDGTIHIWGSGAFEEKSIIKNVNSGILALAWSPDGSLLASAGADGDVKLWEIATIKQRFVLKKHTGIVYALAWSPDGKLLASGGKDTTVRIWGSNTGEQYGVFEDLVLKKRINEIVQSSSQNLSLFFPVVFALAWSSDGRILASGSRANVRIWNSVTGKPEDEINFAGEGGVTSLAWQPDGHLLAIGVGMGQIWLWHQVLKKRVPFPIGHKNEVRALTWSPDGKFLATGGKDRVIRLWNIKDFWNQASKKNIVPKGHDGIVTNVTWGWDGTIMASVGGDQTVRLWNVSTGVLIKVIEKLPGPVFALASYRKGIILVPLQNRRAIIAQWELTRQNLKVLMQMNIGGICSIASSPDGKLVALGDMNGNVWVCEIATKKFLFNFLNRQTEKEYYSTKPNPDPVWALAWSLDNKLLASASSKTTVIWDLVTKRKQAVIDKHKQHKEAGLMDNALELHFEKLALAWSPDSKFLAYGGKDGAIYLWQRDNECKKEILHRHNIDISALAWSPDGLLLASGDFNGTVCLWNHKLGKCLVVGQCLSRVIALQFSRDASILRVADDGTATLNRPIPYVFELCNIDKKQINLREYKEG